MSDRRSAPGSRFRIPLPRKRRLAMHLLLASVLGGALLSVGAVSGLAADKTIEATGGIGTYNWTPETATINANGTVEFKNTAVDPARRSYSIIHRQHPAARACPAPVGRTGAGPAPLPNRGPTISICYVHPTEMTGTITVNSTGPAKPTVTPEAATAIKDTEATLKGSVNPNGEATTYWFEYGTSTAYDHETTHTSTGTTSGSKSATVTGLSANTLYHFRMVAENGIGKTEGGDRTFTTGGPPTVTTEPATGVHSIEATLKGRSTRMACKPNTSSITGRRKPMARKPPKSPPARERPTSPKRKW